MKCKTKTRQTLNIKHLCFNVICMFFIVSNTHAQSAPCPPNIDFETGTFNNWLLYTGTCCPINTTTLSGPVSGRHTITSGSATDPIGGFPTVAPGGGLYSMMLGNANTGAQAERARYYVHVPVSPNRYMLVYRYAVVLEDPQHTATSQPRFEVRAYDSATNVSITCAQYSYIANSAMPGFTLSTTRSNTYYKGWTTATLDLTGMGGQTIAIDFASGDCSLGGHFGYGYIDMQCGLFQIYALNCNSSANITLNAPSGFQHYRWMDSALTTTIDTLQNIILPAPITPRTYAVILTPYSGFGCPDTLYTTYVVANTNVTAANDTTICLGEGPIQLHGSGVTNDTPVSYSWAPIAGLSCINCQSPIVTPTYPRKFYVTATSKSGCSHTDSMFVQVDTVVLADLWVNDDSICHAEEISIKNRYNNPSGATYTWYTDTATVIGTATRDSMRVKWLKDGIKKVALSVAYGVCDHTDTVLVRQSPVISARLLSDTTICLSKRVFLNPQATGAFTPITHNWSPAGTLSCLSCPQTYASPSALTTYYYNASNKYGCKYADTVTIQVDTGSIVANVITTKDTICLREEVNIYNVFNKTPGFTAYTWNTDSALITYNSKDSMTMHWVTPGRKKIKINLPNNYCVFEDSVYVYVKKPDPIFVRTPVKLCAGDSTRLWARSNIKPMNFIWTPSTGLSCTFCDSPYTKVKHDITYYVQGSVEGVCMDMGVVKVDVDSLNAEIEATDDTLCAEQIVKLRNKNTTSANVKYKWTTDSATVITDDGKGNIELYWHTEGLKKVVMSTDNGACVRTDTISIYIIPPLNPYFDMPDSACEGAIVTISPINKNAQYYWKIDNQSVNIQKYSDVKVVWNKTGLYNVKLTMKGLPQCDSESYASTIFISPLPYVSMQAKIESKICAGDQLYVTTNSFGNNTYTWEPQSSIVYTSNNAATMYVPADGKISVTITNDAECSVQSSIDINTKSCCAVIMADAFTPNKDGINDTYKPLGTTDKHKIEVFMITNRWGEIIFQTTNANTGWNGTYKGMEQSTGTYFYYMKYKCNNETMESKGNFILLR